MFGRNCRPGFSKIEVLVVIGIIAVLAGLLLPALSKVRARAARVVDENRFRQIGLAAHAINAQNGRLPPLVGPHRFKPSYVEYQLPVMTWLLPHLEQASLDQLTDPASAGFYYKILVPLYLSPSDRSHSGGLLGIDETAVGNYAANVSVFGSATPNPCGLNDGRAAIPGTFPDGTSNTLLFATKRGRCGGGGSAFAVPSLSGYCAGYPTLGAFFGHNPPPLSADGPTFQDVPTDAECDPEQPQSLQRGGIVVGLADGSVRLVKTGIAPAVWRAALLPNDNSCPKFED